MFLYRQDWRYNRSDITIFLYLVTVCNNSLEKCYNSEVSLLKKYFDLSITYNVSQI